MNEQILTILIPFEKVVHWFFILKFQQEHRRKRMKVKNAITIIFSFFSIKLYINLSINTATVHSHILYISLCKKKGLIFFLLKNLFNCDELLFTRPSLQKNIKEFIELEVFGNFHHWRPYKGSTQPWILTTLELL